MNTSLATAIIGAERLTVFYVHDRHRKAISYASHFRIHEFQDLVDVEPEDVSAPQRVAVHSLPHNLGVFSSEHGARFLTMSTMGDEDVLTVRVEKSPGQWILPGVVSINTN